MEGTSARIVDRFEDVYMAEVGTQKAIQKFIRI